MDMPNLQLLFDAQVNSKASLTLFTYKFGNFANKPFDDKPFAVNALVSMYICCGFRCKYKSIQMKLFHK